MENNRRSDGGSGYRGYSSNQRRSSGPHRRSGRPNDRPSNKRNLPEGFSLYYMAIVCPPEINEQVAVLKSYMYRQFGCVAASKSPAHLTIVPPFRAEDEYEQTLIDFTVTFNMGFVPFDIALNGYDQFSENVLFVSIEDNQALTLLERECMEEFMEKNPSILFGMKPEFHPHITIATRDIPQGKIAGARAYFEENYPMNQSFRASEIKLFKLEDGYWNQRG